MPDAPQQSPKRKPVEEYTGGHTSYGNMSSPSQQHPQTSQSSSAGTASARKSSPIRTILIIALLAFLIYLMASMMGMCGSSTTSTGTTGSTTNNSYNSYNSYSDNGSGMTLLQGAGGTQSTTPQSGTPVTINNLREHYIDTASAKSATVMVYMCGSDLETYSSAATKDLKEMLAADLGDNVNVVIQTGGARKWHFSDKASSRTMQRWLINNDGMYYLEDVGSNSILDTNRVTEFANWASSKYPADRYLFVFWDHGGGTIGGYGNDETNPFSQPLSLLDIRTALANSNQKYDLVGFDACLMGTIECAYALEPVADYMMASEEYEMGDGWMWTGFLSALGANPAIDTVDLAKVAIDDFTNYYFTQRLTNVTLSVVDLREVPYVYEQMGDFLSAAEQAIISDNVRFNEMSQARTQARAFADGSIDQVDVSDLIYRTNFEGKEELLAAVDSCVKYRSGSSITGANGLAMYFPYSEVRQYQGMRSILNDIGYMKPTEFYDYFLSIMSGSPGSSSQGLISSWANAYSSQGSAASAGSSSWSYADSSFFSSDWYEQLLGSFTYQQVPSSLDINYNDGGYVINMRNLWDVFSSFKMTVMEKYGDGLIMLGTDDVYDQTAEGDIVLFYNNEWLTIEGQPVSFFANEPSAEQNGEYSHSGTIPAMLNGDTYIEISVYWPPASQQSGTYSGQIQGYRIPNSNFLTFGRGLIDFVKGDEITPLFDYYDKQGNYVRTEKGNPIVITNPMNLTATYELFDHDTVYFWGTMTTVYGDQIDTKVVEQ